MEQASHIHAQHKNALTLSAPYSTPEKEMQQASMSYHSCSGVPVQKLASLCLDAKPQTISIYVVKRLMIIINI